MEAEQSVDNNSMDENPSTENPNTSEKCAVFWDFENCPPPSGMPGYYVVENLRKVIHRFGSMIALKAYLQITDSTSKKSLRSELQSSGVSLIDCPHNGRKDAADKMILVDMLAFALDTPPPATIVLISGDRDFVYALSTLRNRKYNIVLIVPNKGASVILKSQANMILEWKYDVLNMDDTAELQADYPQTTSGNMSHSASLTNITIKTNLSAIEATNKALEKSVVSPGEYPSFPPPQPRGSKSSLSRLSKSFSSNMINTLNSNQNNMHRCGSQLKYDIDTTDTDNNNNNNNNSNNSTTNNINYNNLMPKNNILYDPALQLSIDGDCGRDQRLSLLSPMVQGYFDLLVEVLDHAKMEGNAMPKQKYIKQQLLKKNPFIFERSGLKSFEDYIKSAEKHGIVKTGDENGKHEQAWISLCE